MTLARQMTLEIRTTGGVDKTLSTTFISCDKKIKNKTKNKNK
jgi:hypothetical protein